MTSPERFRRIDELFTAARDRPPAERTDYLEREAGDDPALIREVLELLAHASTGARNLDDIVGQAAAGIHASQAAAADSRAGQRLGPFTVARKLGEGGMGAVWLGRRDDGLFDQDVAIKFILAEHFSSPAQQARFLRERRILAQLSHPNIARILDGGATSAGEPYFVMEYVDGLPMTRYCEAKHVNMEGRLALWLDACAAVEYAHSKGVIHRDLKPGNILVTSDGIVKVLDFGIARSLNIDKTLTAAGAAWGSPLYSSPEQLEGHDAGVQSDVYSLGAVLLELLTGKPTLTASSSKSGKSGKSGKPGSDTTGPLPRPLRTLARRALAPAPSDRPSTVTEMAGEARAYLLDLQLARHGTWRRRWVPVAAIVVAVAVLAGGLVSWRMRLASSSIPPLDQLPWRHLTTTGDVVAMALSPDGSTYVMSRPDAAAGLTAPSLWLRRASSPRLAKVLDSGIIPGSFWFISISSDEWIYINTSAGVLWRLPLLGGTPQKLRESVGYTVHSPDGRRCVYHSVAPASRGFHIADADCVSSARPLPLLQLDGGSYYSWTADSRALVFILGDGRPAGKRWAARLDADSGARETLFEIPQPERVLRVVEAPAGAWLVNMRDSDAGVYGLWHRKDGRSVRISNPALGFQLSGLLRDVIFGVQESYESTLHEADIDRQTSRQISRGTGSHDSGHYLKDGRIITKLRVGTASEIWILAADGTPERQVLQRQGPIDRIVVDEEEREVLFMCRVGPGFSVWRADIMTGRQERLIPSESVSAFALSPDGRRIAYVQSAGPLYNVFEVLRRDPGRVLWQAAAVEHVPVYAPDSRSLFYVRADAAPSGRATLRDVESGRESDLSGSPLANIVAWAQGPATAFPDLAIVSPNRNRNAFDAFSRATSRQRPLWRLDASLTPRCWILNPDLRADGAALLYTRTCGTSDLVSLQLP